MSQELIQEIENLIEFGYGDTNRLDSIVNALENGHSLYQSDQTYVDMLISKCLYPHIEENWSVKKRVGSLDQKIQNVKRDYRNKTETEINDEIPVNFCGKCGSTVSRMYSSCKKCGTLHDEYNFGELRKEKPKQKRHAEPITEDRDLSLIIVENAVWLFQKQLNFVQTVEHIKLVLDTEELQRTKARERLLFYHYSLAHLGFLELLIGILAISGEA